MYVWERERERDNVCVRKRICVRERPIYSGSRKFNLAKSLMFLVWVALNNNVCLSSLVKYCRHEVKSFSKPISKIRSASSNTKYERE